MEIVSCPTQNGHFLWLTVRLPEGILSDWAHPGISTTKHGIWAANFAREVCVIGNRPHHSITKFYNVLVNHAITSYGWVV